MLIYVLIALLPAVASCARGGMRTEQDLMQNSKNSGNRLVDKYNLQIAALGGMQNAAGHGPDADYEIGPQDLLDISVFEVKEMTNTVRVSGNGYIGMPLVGRIKAEGLTSVQLEDLIARKLRRYLQDPTVSVFIKQYRSQPISVLGAVRAPKIYYVTGQMHLLDMLAMAGGLAPDAGNVCIVQSVGSGKDPKQTVVNLEELLNKGHAGLNIPVYGGQIVDVPRGGMFFVDGAVHKPGSFRIEGNTTLTQAISMADGFAYSAVKSNIRIYRATGTAKRKMLAVNYESILKGKSPDLALQDRDVIIVPENGFKSFLRGFSTFIGMGPFSVGRYGGVY
ncbi:MAG: polysaccharide export protein [Nitrospiraceae bacterium]|nr:polysaccharide export protein [Nitrospiraceae bacterium]